jgi:hypothetical protein
VCWAGFENDKQWPVLLTLTLWSVGIGDSVSRRLIHRPRGSPWSEPWYELVAKPCAAVGAVNLLQDDSVDNLDEFSLMALASTHPLSVAG